MDLTTKATNPKDAVATDKVPLHLAPPVAVAYMCLAFADGALKYGTWNWRMAGIRASIYVAAAKRHIDAWFHGERNDPDSGIHNLGHAMACLAIIIDAEFVQMMVDDRAPSIDLRSEFNKLNITMGELRKLREGQNPRHYTIVDKIVPLAEQDETADAAPPGPAEARTPGWDVPHFPKLPDCTIIPLSGRDSNIISVNGDDDFATVVNARETERQIPKGDSK